MTTNIRIGNGQTVHKEDPPSWSPDLLRRAVCGRTNEPPRAREHGAVPNFRKTTRTTEPVSCKACLRTMARDAYFRTPGRS